MLKRIFAVAAAASVSLLGATAATPAHAQPAGHLPGLKVINLHRAYQVRLGHTRPGRISGIVYSLNGKHRTAVKAASCTAEPNCPMVYNGGSVQHGPKVYLLLWGPSWTSDPSQAASATFLQNFYGGLGVQPQDDWSTTTSQYADGTGAPAFPGSVFAGFFQDTSAPPAGATQAQLAAEADAFTTAQGITDLTDAQIVVATQSGTCPSGFACGGNPGYCAYHSSSSEPYTNLPYLLDAGANCGEDFVNPAPGGNNDGWSIVGGHEFAESITDPFPGTGWVDPNDSTSGGEIGDKCAWGGQLWGGNDPIGNVTLSTGTFAMQSLWSNAAGTCVMTGAIKDSISITSPLPQTNVIGDSVNLPIQGSSSAGNPLAWSAIGLPAGLAINAATGTITGTPTTAAVYGVTVTASDKAGASRSVSFGWTITTAGGPVVGDHGKCLDDAGSSTLNGNKVDVWTCNGTGAQKWTFSGGALSVLGKCLDDASQGGAGSPLVIWTCNGHKAQTWTHKSNGEYVLKLNGLCLTDPSGSTVNGTQVQVRTCKNYADQHWTGP